MFALLGTPAPVAKRQQDPFSISVVGSQLTPSKPAGSQPSVLPALPGQRVPLCQQTLHYPLAKPQPPSSRQEERRTPQRPTGSGECSPMVIRSRSGSGGAASQHRGALREAMALRTAIATHAVSLRPVEAAASSGEATEEDENVPDQRLKTLRRLRERREQRQKMEESARRQEVEARSGFRLREAKLREEQELREAYRAEVYAINRLLAARDDAAFAAYMESRRPQLEAIEARHAEEMEARRKEGSHADSIFRERLKQVDREARADKAREKREAEAREKREEARREEMRRGEAEREIKRAQIYAINKLMRAREEAAFAEFKRLKCPADTEADSSLDNTGVDPSEDGSHGTELMIDVQSSSATGSSSSDTEQPRASTAAATGDSCTTTVAAGSSSGRTKQQYTAAAAAKSGSKEGAASVAKKDVMPYALANQKIASVPSSRPRPAA
ncbi:hypothetical protein AB1Y20_022190 [Prymnesium parvum]|uniref:Meiosis-specific nuclear structural protein 1 n=1 Tax=Prymnesium parvum TaxID=97485 RepID=A0AB34JGM3_PRYPA